MQDGFERNDAEELRLPLEPRTILAGLWRRRLLFLFIIVLSTLAGTAAGLLFGKRVYQAETVLRYVPVSGRHSDDVHRILQTELNQVKVVQNLSKVRFKLSIPATLDELGEAVDVSIHEGSSLMSISAKWKTAAMAAAIANTLRDVYLRNWLSAQAAKLDRFMAQTSAELKTLDSQADRLAGVIEDLRKQVAQEQDAAAAGGRQDVVARYNKLREAIAEDKARRANMAELAQRELELERARKLRQKDLISPAEYEKTLAAYRRQKALTIDSARTRAWKEELEKLSTMVGSASGQGVSPTEALLQTTLMRSFDLDLRRVALQEKLNDLRAARDTILESIDNPALLDSTGPDFLKRNRKGQAPPLHETLARVLGAHDVDAGAFEIVSEAEAPVYPLKSTRKLVAVAVAAAGILLGFLGILGREIMDPTVRSASEIPVKLDVPVVGMLPRVPREALALPGDPGSEMVESSRILAERLRVMLDMGKKPVVVVTSAARKEGRTLVSAFLAGAFARRGDDVLLVDGEVRGPRPKRGLEFLCPGEVDRDAPGLGELLAGGDLDPGDVVQGTVIRGVRLIPRGVEIEAPEPLASDRMREVLEYGRREASLTMVVAPPALPRVDAGLVASLCDDVVMVVRAERTRVTLVKRALRQLANLKVDILGVILNGVSPEFLDKD